MRGKILVLVLGLVLIGVKLFAADGDFKVESLNNTDMLVVDAGNDRVLIGANTSDSATGHQLLSLIGSPVRRPKDGIAAVSASVQTTDDSNIGFGGIYFHERSSVSPVTFSKNTIGISGRTMVEKKATVTGVMAGVHGLAANYNHGGTVSDMRGVWGMVSTESVNGPTNITDAYSVYAEGGGFHNLGGAVTVGNAYNFYGTAHWGFGSHTITNAYGLYLANQTEGTNNYGIVLDGNDNSSGGGASIWFGNNQDARIYWDGTNLFFDTDSVNQNGMAYFSKEVSAIAFNTRTTVWDKKKGKALDFLKDADNLTNASGEILHENFPEKVTYKVTDHDNCWEVIRKVEYCWNDNTDIYCVNNISDVPENVTYYTREYKDKQCSQKNETGVSMNLQIAKHEQALYEAYQLIKELQSELCIKDSSYRWCK